MRNDKIVFLSVLAAVAVVFLHLPHSGGWLDRAACCLCDSSVPFFFCVSGYFLGRHVNERRWWIVEVGKRVRSILLPYIIWSTIFGVYVEGQILVANYLNHASLWRNALHLVDVYAPSPFSVPLLCVLWYLRSLFFFVVVSPILLIFQKTRKSAILFLIVLFIQSVVLMGILPMVGQWSSFIKYFISPMGLFYFSSGLFLSRYESPKVRYPAITIIVALLGAVFYSMSVGSKEIAGTMVSSCLHELSCLLFLIGMWGVSRNVRLPKFLQVLPLPMYLMHIMIIDIVVKSVSLGCHVDVRGILQVPLLMIVVLACIAVCNLLRVCFPKFSRLAFGGRV